VKDKEISTQQGKIADRLKIFETPSILYNYISFYVMGGIFLSFGIAMFYLDLSNPETMFTLFPLSSIESIMHWPIYYGIILLLTLNFLKVGTKLKRTKPIHGARKVFRLLAIISSVCLYLLSVIHIIFYEINLFSIVFVDSHSPPFAAVTFIIGPILFGLICLLFVSLLLTTVLELVEKKDRKIVNKKPLVLMLIIFLIFTYSFYYIFIEYGLSKVGEGNLGLLISRVVLCILYCIIGTILLVIKRRWKNQLETSPEWNKIWN